MSKPMQHKTVFISYRRAVMPYLARILSTQLRAVGFDVFRDIEDLGPGEFSKLLLEQIDARAHFLVLLSHGTLDRCVDPDDWLRREIKYATDKKRNIIPILVENFTFEDGEKFMVSHELKKLKDFHAQRLMDEFYDDGFRKLLDMLNQPVQVDLESMALEQEKVEELIEQIMEDPELTKAELDAEKAFTQGMLSRGAEDYETAENYFTEALSYNPKYAEAFNNRGLTRRKRGNLPGAISDYTSAIGIKPDYAEAFNNRALDNYNQNKTVEAIKDYTEAIRLEPNYAEAFYGRGMARQMEWNRQGAIDDYTDAIRLNPNHTEAYYKRGYLRDRLDDFEGAMADYTEVIRRKPDFTEAYKGRGIVREKLGDVQGAMADYTEVIRRKPDATLMYNMRANLFFFGKRFVEASRDFEKAVSLQPDNTLYRSGLAITCHALGRTDEAQGLWRKLIAEDERFRDIDWVQQEFNWVQPLIDEARKLIASL